MIAKFIEKYAIDKKPVRIYFKTRSDIMGIFLLTRDFEELKRKNFWRIVAAPDQAEWLRTGNISCSRLYSGESFFKLSEV